MSKSVLSWHEQRAGGTRKKRGFIDRHFGWRRFLEKDVQGKTTFARRTPWDYIGYTGVIAIVLIVLQMSSGLLLLLHYVPDPEQAFASYQMIRNEVPFGAFYSEFHSINASLIILVLFIHMFRIMLISAHRGPREVQWYVGAILLFIILLTGFSGYLLPWSQQSYWAGVIATESARALPLIGDWLVELLRGGEAMSGATLRRFFALHVSVLPALLVILTWYHVKRVWKAGVIAPAETRAEVGEDECISCSRCERECSFDAITMIERDGKKLPAIDKGACNACRACEMVCPANCIEFADHEGPAPREPILPHNAIDRAKAVLVTLIILAIGVFFIHDLLTRVKVPADPLLTPDAIKPEWYFLATYQALRELPSELWGLASIIAVALIVFFLPAIDKRGPREPSKRPVYIFLVVAGIVGFIVLTIRGLF